MIICAVLCLCGGKDAFMWLYVSIGGLYRMPSKFDVCVYMHGICASSEMDIRKVCFDV